MSALETGSHSHYLQPITTLLETVELVEQKYIHKWCTATLHAVPDQVWQRGVGTRGWGGSEEVQGGKAKAIW